MVRNTSVAHSDFGMNPCRLILAQKNGFFLGARLYDPLSGFPTGESIRAIGDLARKIAECGTVSYLTAITARHPSSIRPDPECFN